jgi:hypothetical protein
VRGRKEGTRVPVRVERLEPDGCTGQRFARRDPGGRPVEAHGAISNKVAIAVIIVLGLETLG